MHRRVSILLTIPLLLTLSGCDLLWFGTAGNLSVDVGSTSLPDDRLVELHVVVESVSAVSTTGEVHWLVADHEPMLDLFSLQSRPARVARGVELPQGHYGTVTLKLAPTAEAVLIDGSHVTLEVSPRNRSISIPDFEFDDGRDWVELRLTFDVSNSLRDFLSASNSDENRFRPDVSLSSLAFGDRK